MPINKKMKREKEKTEVFLLMKYHSAVKRNKLHYRRISWTYVKQKPSIKDYISYVSIFMKFSEQAKLTYSDEVRMPVTPAGGISWREA